MPWPTTPRWAQRQAPMASPPRPEHQATLAPHAQGPAPPPSPRTHTHAPTPARAPTHRTTVSSAHLRFGGVWWLSTVRSALEPDSQVVQPCGGAGKEVRTRGPALA